MQIHTKQTMTHRKLSSKIDFRVRLTSSYFYSLSWQDCQNNNLFYSNFIAWLISKVSIGFVIWMTGVLQQTVTFLSRIPHTKKVSGLEISSMRKKFSALILIYHNRKSWYSDQYSRLHMSHMVKVHTKKWKNNLGKIPY